MKNDREKIEMKEKKALGLDPRIDEIKETVAETKKVNPAMVCAQTILDTTLVLDSAGEFKAKVPSGKILVAPYNVYRQLKTDRQGRNVLKPYRNKFSEYFRRYAGEDLSGKSLLVWRTGGLGDIMFSQPIIQYLKKKYPTCRIIYATIPRNIGLLTCWPLGLVDRVVSMPFSLELLKTTDYHLTFEGCIERCRQAERDNCYDIFQEMANVKFDPREYPVKLNTHPQIIEALRPIFEGNKVVLVQPRATSVLRTLPQTTLTKITKGLQDLGFFVGFADSIERSTQIKMIAQSMQKDVDLAKIMNLASVSKGPEFAIAMSSLCSGAIVTDSAYSHFFPALGKPVVGIYGAFKGVLRMRYYDNADWVEPPTDWNECGHKPCFFHESKLFECPYIKDKKLPGCLEAINVDEVLNKFIALYDKVNPNDRIRQENSIPRGNEADISRTEILTEASNIS